MLAKFILGLGFLMSFSGQASPISELIVPKGTYPANHGSTIASLTNGDLLACWFAGSREGGRDVEIVCSRKASASDEWAAPKAAVKRQESAEGSWYENKFVGNPVVFEDDEHTLWLFYEAVQWGGHSGAFIDYKTSSDFGKNWSNSKRLVGGVGNFGHLPRNKPLRLEKNRFLLPVYREFTSKYGYVFDLTLTGAKIAKQATYPIPGKQHIQPTLVRTAEDEVRAFLRDTSSSKKVQSATLDLGTKSWTRVSPINLPNPNSAADAVQDPSGKIYIVYNDSASGRSPLSLASSTDGKTFTKVFDFETEAGDFSYPAVILSSDGSYHLTYTYNRKTIKYVRFTQDWLDSLE